MTPNPGRGRDRRGPARFIAGPRPPAGQGVEKPAGHTPIRSPRDLAGAYRFAASRAGRATALTQILKLADWVAGHFKPGR